MGGNGVQRNYEKRPTVSINKSDLPTCAQIAKFLEDYGDKKLFSGSTDLGVVGDMKVIIPKLTEAIEKLPRSATHAFWDGQVSRFFQIFVIILRRGLGNG